MISQTHIIGYALALFELAKEDKKLSEFKAECLALLEAFEEAPQYLSFISSFSMSTDARAELVKNGIGRKTSKTMKNFLMLMAARGKANKIPFILRKTVSLINEDLGINEGVVYTPEKLTSKQVDDLARRVAMRLKLNELFLINKIDKNLIAGFRADVMGDVVEDSALSRLANLRTELLKKEE